MQTDWLQEVLIIPCLLLLLSYSLWDWPITCIDWWQDFTNKNANWLIAGGADHPLPAAAPLLLSVGLTNNLYWLMAWFNKQKMPTDWLQEVLIIPYLLLLLSYFLGDWPITYIDWWHDFTNKNANWLIAGGADHPLPAAPPLLLSLGLTNNLYWMTEGFDKYKMPTDWLQEVLIIPCLLLLPSYSLWDWPVLIDGRS